MQVFIKRMRLYFTIYNVTEQSSVSDIFFTLWEGYFLTIVQVKIFSKVLYHTEQQQRYSLSCTLKIQTSYKCLLTDVLNFPSSTMAIWKSRFKKIL